MKKNLFILILGLFMVGFGSNSPKDVAKEFVKAGYDGNADKIISLLYFPDGSEANGAKDMVVGKIKSSVKNQQKFAERFGGVDSIEAISEDVKENNLVIVKIEVKFKKDGKTMSDNVRLKKIKNEWKISII